MKVDVDILARFAGPLLAAVVGWGLARASERRAKLIAYYGHVGAFTMHGPPQEFHVFTHEVVIRNVGRKLASNVRVSHHVLPQFNVSPAVPYSVEGLPTGGRDIVISALVPGQQVVVSYLYEPPTTYQQVTTGVRCDDGFAKVLPVLLMRQYSPRVVFALRVLVVTGALTLLYLAGAMAKALAARVL